MDSMIGVLQPIDSSLGSALALSDSSTAIHRALDHIDRATRLLCGDSQPSLQDLISSSGAMTGADVSMNAATAAAVAAAIAPVGVSSFDGGLSCALPSLLAPLLSIPSGSVASTAETLYMIRQAAFQPRRCLACARELRVLLSGEDRDDVVGQAGALVAVKMAFEVQAKRHVPGTDDGTSSSSSPHAPSQNATRLLEQRKNRRQRSDQTSAAGMDVALDVWGRPSSSIDSHDGLTNAADERERGRSAAKNEANPEHENSVAVAHRFMQRTWQDGTILDLDRQSSSAARVPDVASQQQHLTVLLNEWQKTLADVDAEASASLGVSLHWLSAQVARVRLDVDHVGSVIVWLQWTASLSLPTSQASLRADGRSGGDKEGDGRANDEEISWSYDVRIERVNVLAEAESNLLSSTRADDSVCGDARTIQNDDGATRLSTPSSFPLYRQLASRLLARVLRSSNALQNAQTQDDADAELQKPSSGGSLSSLVVLLGCLFAGAQLCRLHDPLHSFALHAEQLPQRTVGTTMEDNV